MSSVAKTQQSSMYDKFCDYMRNDTKGVEIISYSISGLLLAVAYYKIRPITKFTKASDIPNHFVRDKVTQYGKVVRIEPSPSGPLVHVNHKPPVDLFFASKKTLPVKISGIEVNSNGYSWLQTVLANKKVEFVPVATDNTFATVQLVLKDVDMNKKAKNLDVAQALLSLGFARAESVPKVVDTEKDKELLKYYKYLLAVEKKAKNRRLGLWSSSLPPLSWPAKQAQNAFDHLVISITPPSKRLPGLLR